MDDHGQDCTSAMKHAYTMQLVWQTVIQKSPLVGPQALGWVAKQQKRELPSGGFLHGGRVDMF